MEGQAAQKKLLTSLQALPEPGRLIISLNGVEVLSGSFADSAIAFPYSRLITGEYGDRYMLLRSSSAEITEDLSHKLERRGLAMLCLTGADWRPLGLLPPAMKDTLALVIRYKETTAKKLASELHIRHNACLHRLARLTELRLIRREQMGIAGPYPAYRFLSILPA